MKSLRPIAEGDEEEPPAGGGGRNPEVDWRGEKRANATHRSATDPEARLAKIKGKEAKPCYRGHLLTENRNGLIVECELTQATGSAEREAGLRLVARRRGRRKRRRMSVGADRGYDTREFVRELRVLRVTPHVAPRKRAAAPSTAAPPAMEAAR